MMESGKPGSANSGTDVEGLDPTRQEAVNAISATLQTKEREAVVMSLHNSMHPGQIIMLTKLLTATDLRFYGFEDGVPVERWRSEPSGLELGGNGKCRRGY